MTDVSMIIAYESDELSAAETIQLFSQLVASGVVWSLQGHYGRMATALINGGYLAEDGTVLATVVRTDEEEE